MDETAQAGWQSILASALSTAAFEALLDEHMPQVRKQNIRIEQLGHGTCRVSMAPVGDVFRAGGSIAGPTIFALADLALYGAVLSRVGPMAMAVTSQMSINFLRRPGPVTLVGEGRLLRLGRRLAYGEVTLFSEGEADPVAHATGSYALPERN